MPRHNKAGLSYSMCCRWNRKVLMDKESADMEEKQIFILLESFLLFVYFPMNSFNICQHLLT